MGGRSCALLAVLLLGLAGAALGQLSKPIADDSNVDGAANKYLQRQASQDEAVNVHGCVEPCCC